MPDAPPDRSDRETQVERGGTKSRRPAESPDRAAERLEQAALRYLTRHDRTEAQVRTYLERAGAAPELAEALLARFCRRGYVNDAVYAGRWAAAKLAQRPMGRARLEAELTAQGFEPVTVAAALAQAYEGCSEQELAHILLSRRGRSQPAAKQAALLRRHGFDDDIIQHCVGDQGA